MCGGIVLKDKFVMGTKHQAFLISNCWHWQPSEERK